MDFIDTLKQFSKRVETLKDNIQTEEATKTAIIMPFFQLLGYDVFNPDVFIPEYTADVGIKKGEKVDYAIMSEGNPVILIEAKWIGEDLSKHDSQLFRYFSTTCAKFAILTNGIIYRFYTDLDELNKMDEKPFLEINILDIKENQISELKKFHKDNFDLDTIIDSASELKYSYEFKNVLSQLLNNPSDDFVKLMLKDVYSGLKTQNVIEKFKPVIKKTFNQFISDLMNDKIKSALNTNENSGNNEAAATNVEDTTSDEMLNKKIITTEEELQSFYIIKAILMESAPSEDITYKDTETYLGILYKHNTRKWICRLKLADSAKTLIIPGEEKKETVEILCEIDNKIVAAKQKNIIVTAFHPELTDDLSFLSYFLKSTVR